jgi:hypothetical protein
MSFGINGPDNLPAIQKAQNAMNNGGGGGNLGYFQQRRKKKDDKNERDVLDLSTGKKDEENFEEDIDLSLKSIGSHIKDFWSNLKSGKEIIQETNDETKDKENPEE